MGTWGTGYFDNDTALDWVSFLAEAADKLEFVCDTLEESDSIYEIVAACATIWSVLGGPQAREEIGYALVEFPDAEGSAEPEPVPVDLSDLKGMSDDVVMLAVHALEDAVSCELGWFDKTSGLEWKAALKTMKEKLLVALERLN